MIIAEYAPAHGWHVEPITTEEKKTVTRIWALIRQAMAGYRVRGASNRLANRLAYDEVIIKEVCNA